MAKSVKRDIVEQGGIKTVSEQSCLEGTKGENNKSLSVVKLKITFQFLIRKDSDSLSSSNFKEMAI